MNTLYRIFTERKNETRIAEIVTAYIDGCTLLYGTGYWRGVPEQSLVIEIIGTKRIRTKVNAIAQAIKKANKQQAVLVETLANNAYLI